MPQTTPPVSTDLPKFWTHLFADERGLLQVWTAIRDETGRLPKKTIRENFFNYPDAARQAAEWALDKAAENCEVYFCCHLLNAPRRLKENAAKVSALWGDLDGAPIPTGALAPTCVVESSPGHFHCYWGLARAVKPEVAEDLNRRLAREIGADPSGFDLTQLLRVPGTINLKRGDPHAVEVISLVHDFRSPDELDELLPKLEEPETNPGYETEEDGEEEEPPVALGSDALEVWRGKQPKVTDSGQIDRSAALLQIGRVLYDAGLARRGVVEAIKERDAALGWHKYTGRRNADECYAAIFAELERNGRTQKVRVISGGRSKDAGTRGDDDGFTQFTQSSEKGGEKLPEPLPFPVEAMPRNCRRLIKEGAQAIGCPPDFIGSAMLVTLGSAIGNSRRARVKRGWSEGASIYGGIIAAPGDKKTAAQNLGTSPAVKQQIKLREKYREEVEAYKQKHREWELEKKGAGKNNEAAPPPEPQPPVMERTVVGDSTVEAIARILDENPRGVGVFRDELAAWVRSMDQYKASGKGAERQFWLSAWSNATASFDRKGQTEPTIIPRPFVGLFGSIQPEVLPDLHGDRGDGQLERFLFSYPRPVHSEWTDDDISWEAEVSYSNLYLNLRDLKMSEGGEGELPEPRFTDFDEGGKALFIGLYNAHQVQRRMPGFPQVLNLAWPKLEGYLVRISLILAMSRYVSEGGSERITETDVKSAALLVAYFKNNAHRVYAALYGEAPEDILARDLVRFLAERGGHFRGEPTELYESFHSRAKPKSAHWLAHHIKKISETSRGLSFEDGHEAIRKTDTKTGKSTRRVIELYLENCVNCVNLLGEWMAG